MSVTILKRDTFAPIVIRKESKKKKRQELKQSLKRIVEVFNYATEPNSINMEGDPLGKW